MATVSPARPVLLVLGAALLACAGLYLSFELGRYRAGFSLFDQRRNVAQLTAEIAAGDARIEALQRRQAILETSGEIDAETYSAVKAELAALQARIQGLEEELAFYRGIVSPGDGVAGLRIQNVEILPGPAGRAHLLRLLLVQAIVHNDRVAGTVRIRVSGTQGAEPVMLGLSELAAAGGPEELDYGFRYFQSIEQELTLPEGFVPGQVAIEIWPQEPRGETVTQEFEWAQVSR